MEILENKIAEKYIKQFNVVAWVTVIGVISSILTFSFTEYFQYKDKVILYGIISFILWVAFIDRLRLSLLSIIGAVKK